MPKSIDQQDLIHPVAPNHLVKKAKKKVLILCEHNTARSQMAEGFFRTLYGERYDAYSAGLTLGQVNAYAVRVMEEVGINISNQRSKSYKEYSDEEFDIVIATCTEASEICPFVPAKQFLYWPFPNPAQARGTDQEIMAAFRKVRDMIRERIISAVTNGEI